MRVLFATPPGAGHSLPVVPLAWALRAAGHDVVLATTGRGAAGLSPVRGTGLPVVDVAPGIDVDIVLGRFTADPGVRATTRKARVPQDLEFATAVFADLSDLLADGMMSLALAWDPDVVVHSPLDGTGPLVAAKLGVPAIQHGLSFAETPKTAWLIAGLMAETYHRYSVAYAPASALGLDITPPSMRLADDLGTSMRYIAPAGGVVPDWLLRPSARPRVAVTFGTVLPELPVLQEFDAEVLVIGEQTAGLPPNARALGWVPLAALLPHCNAVIHHGGAGTTLTALAAGVPQLLLPQGADHFVNTEAVVRSGAGITGGDVGPLLSDPAYWTAAQRIKAEMAAMPAPAELVSTVEALSRR